MEIKKEIQKSVVRATREESEEDLLGAVPGLESEALMILLVAEELEDAEVSSLSRNGIPEEDLDADEFESLRVDADRIVDRLSGKSHVSETGEL